MLIGKRDKTISTQKKLYQLIFRIDLVDILFILYTLVFFQ